MSAAVKKSESHSPNPDLGPIFSKLNKDWFQSKIRNVEVKWSSRMTVCAGICTYHGKKEGAVIHLSLPLLSLRTRRDLIDIMLHEMIHAYLYVVDGNKEREEHGPKFKQIMDRINEKAGTHITIFHTFDNEVESLKKHWWRCTGNCKSLPPMYGLVMRSMNRVPGPAEDWWKQHKKACTGNFIKVKEPSPSPRPQLTAKRRSPSILNSVSDMGKTTVKRRINSTPCSSGNKENTKPKPGRKRGQSTSCPLIKSRSTYKKPKRSGARAEHSDSDIETVGESAETDLDSLFDDAFSEECNFCPACGTPLPAEISVEEHLMNCPVLNTDEAGSNVKYPCPICQDWVSDEEMNVHLDHCVN